MDKLTAHNLKQAAKRIKKAQAIKNLVDSGKSVADVARIKKLSRSRVYYLLASLK